MVVPFLREGLRGRKVDAEMPVVKSGFVARLAPTLGGFGLRFALAEPQIARFPMFAAEVV